MTIHVSPRQRRRWLVHLALIVTAIVSVVFEFVLTVHIVVGLVFVGLVAPLSKTSELINLMAPTSRRSS